MDKEQIIYVKGLIGYYAERIQLCEQRSTQANYYIGEYQAYCEVKRDLEKLLTMEKKEEPPKIESKVEEPKEDKKPVRKRKHSAVYWATKREKCNNSPYSKEATANFFKFNTGGDYDKARELYETVKAEPSAHINKDGSIKPKGHAVALRFVKKQYPDVYKEMELVSDSYTKN